MVDQKENYLETAKINILLEPRLPFVYFIRNLLLFTFTQILIINLGLSIFTQMILVLFVLDNFTRSTFVTFTHPDSVQILYNVDLRLTQDYP